MFYLRNTKYGSSEQTTGRVGDLVGCVQAIVCSVATPRSTLLVRFALAWSELYVRTYYGSRRRRAACRRNISPVKSLARPLRRTACLACASRRAPTETRAPLAQSNVQQTLALSSLVGLHRPTPCAAPCTRRYCHRPTITNERRIKGALSSLQAVLIVYCVSV